jgi:hypothetical protein
LNPLQAIGKNAAERFSVISQFSPVKRKRKGTSFDENLIKLYIWALNSFLIFQKYTIIIILAIF